MHSFDVLIVGAGIVGLSTAYQLIQEQPGLSIAIVDKELGPAAHQTGHNSGVIHSGIYYKPGSHRAINCRKGYDQLLQFCERHAIPFERCGKVIVASNAKEAKVLPGILERGKANGLEGIRMIGPEETREKEPFVQVEKAIWVPQTGIIDYKQVAEKYLELFRENGGTSFFKAKVKAIKQEAGGTWVSFGEYEAKVKLLINCAGLYADQLSNKTGMCKDLQVIPFRGEYYVLKREKQYLVNNLIYPVPNPHFPFLGVHFTRMIKGGIEAGPNAVLAFSREGYSRWDINLAELTKTIRFSGFRKLAFQYWREGLDELYRSYSKKAFVRALQKLLPEIQAEDLERGGAGVRAMAVNAEGEMLDDFLFAEAPGVINVCNAPSPAATASLAIGAEITGRAARHLEG